MYDEMESVSLWDVYKIILLYMNYLMMIAVFTAISAKACVWVLVFWSLMMMMMFLGLMFWSMVRYYWLNWNCYLYWLLVDDWEWNMLLCDHWSINWDLLWEIRHSLVSLFYKFFMYPFLLTWTGYGTGFSTVYGTFLITS